MTVDLDEEARAAMRKLHASKEGRSPPMRRFDVDAGVSKSAYRVLFVSSAAAYFWTLLAFSWTPGGGAFAAGNGAPQVAGPDPAPAVPKVVFSVDRVSAKPGGTAKLTLSVESEAKLRVISIALNFDESKVRAINFRRVPPPEDIDPVPIDDPAPADIASNTVSNENKDAGNQINEGWIHFELVSTAEKAAIAVKPGLKQAVLEIEFQVLANATAGFSRVDFESVGPVNAVPAMFFVNRVEFAEAEDVESPGGKNIDDEDLQGGGIDIIGEIGFFMRGDSSFDRHRDITDPIATLSYLFTGGQRLRCLDSADSNDDGSLDIADPVHTLLNLFQVSLGFPEPQKWGLDPTPDSLGCEVYSTP